MAQIISTLKWTYVAVVKESGNYGERFAEDLKAAMKKTNACVATDKTIPFSDDEQRYTQVLEELSSEDDLRNVKIIVVFAQEDVVRKLLKYTTIMNLTNRWIWVSSDAWGYKTYPVAGYEGAAVNAITIAPKKYKIEVFDSYFHQLKPQTHTKNPWFNEYWEEEFKCNVEQNEFKDSYRSKMNSKYNERACTGNERQAIYNEFSQESFVHFVVDAVFATAIAIEKTLDRVCENGQYCKQFESVSGIELQQTIRNVSFTSMSGREVRFDRLGNGICGYEIFQFQYDENSNDFTYNLIGSYETVNEQYKLILDFEKLQFWDKSPSTYTNRLINQGDLRGSGYRTHGHERKTDVQVGWRMLKEAPLSFCQQECEAGVIKINTRNKCCWTCKRCARHHIAVNETECVECLHENTANENQTRCVPMEPIYVDIADPLSIAAMVLASVGLLVNSLLATVFIYYSNTPIIKASARELCHILILGMTCCYAMTFSLVAKPGIVSCSINRIGVSLALSICLSALLTKTNRISRIFNRDRKSLQKTSFVSPLSQLLICFAIVTVQILVIAVWFVLRPPAVNRIVEHARDGKRLILTCESGNQLIAVSLPYSMVMVVSCTVYAFKTRKIPANFNEAKYIGFTMYSVCIVWLAFIAIYFGVASSEHWFRLQILSIAMCLNLCAYVITGCLFVPKVYVVLFQPRKNVRQKPNIKRLITRTAMYDSMQVVREDVIGAVLGLRQTETSENAFKSSESGIKSITSSTLSASLSKTARDNTDLISTGSLSASRTHSHTIDDAKGSEDTQVIPKINPEQSNLKPPEINQISDAERNTIKRKCPADRSSESLNCPPKLSPIRETRGSPQINYHSPWRVVDKSNDTVPNNRNSVALELITSKQKESIV